MCVLRVQLSGAKRIKPEKVANRASFLSQVMAVSSFMTPNFQSLEINALNEDVEDPHSVPSFAQYNPGLFFSLILGKRI